MSQLFDAHRQWRDRPVEERFATLKAMQEVVAARRSESVVSPVYLPQLKFGGAGNDIWLQGEQHKAYPSHWSFGQLCSLMDVPAPYLRRVPGELAATNLNWATQNASRDRVTMLWANHSETNTIRAFTTPSYGRIWDETVIGWLRQMTNDETGGWKRPPAKTDNLYPSGYYAGDRNMFVFMVNEDVRIDDGSPDGLARGFFCWNTEVGQMSIGFSAFLYQYICGNHIVWGARELFKSVTRVFHSGALASARASAEIGLALRNYVQSTAAAEQAVVDTARKKAIGRTQEDAVDFLSDRKFKYSRAESTAIVAKAMEMGNDPTILWNLVDAATRLSQEKKFTDERTEADRQAGRLLEVVF